MKMKRKAVELRLRIPGGHVAAMAWGSPRNQPVLLVHGTMENAGSFTRLIQLLPENYYYVAIDQPGHGFSSHYPNGIPLDFLQGVLLLKYVLDALQWEKCYYIGHSAGAATAPLFQALFPSRFEKIVALDIVSGYNFSPNEIVERFRAVCSATVEATKKRAPRLYTREEILDTLQNRRVLKLNREAAEAVFDRATTRMGDKYVYNTDERLKTYVMPCFNFDQYAAFFRKQTSPILLISAKDSWYKTIRQIETLDLIKKNFSDKITVVHVDGDHNVHNNNPAVVVPHIVKFFADQESKL